MFRHRKSLPQTNSSTVKLLRQDVVQEKSKTKTKIQMHTKAEMVGNLGQPEAGPLLPTVVAWDIGPRADIRKIVDSEQRTPQVFA